MKLRRDPSKRPPVARVLGGVLIFQLGLAGLLFWGDLDEGLRLPGFGPRAPGLTEPTRPGDQTRQLATHVFRRAGLVHDRGQSGPERLSRPVPRLRAIGCKLGYQRLRRVSQLQQGQH